jgi:hypothetical protein
MEAQMEPRMIGVILVGIGVLDFFIGSFLVVPKIPETNRSKIRLAVAVASLLTIGLGTSFLMGWVGGV